MNGYKIYCANCEAELLLVPVYTDALPGFVEKGGSAACNPECRS
jgi:hypothetical protein